MKYVIRSNYGYYCFPWNHTSPFWSSLEKASRLGKAKAEKIMKSTLMPSFTTVLREDLALVHEVMDS